MAAMLAVKAAVKACNTQNDTSVHLDISHAGQPSVRGAMLHKRVCMRKRDQRHHIRHTSEQF